VGHVVGPLHAQVEHEGGEREALLGERLRGPALEGTGRHQLGGGVAEVRVHDHLVRAFLLAVGQHHALDLAPVEEQALDRGLVAEGRTELARHLGHGDGNLGEAAARVEDAVAVLDEGDHRVETGAAPRRHAQVLGLEGEGDPGLLAREVAAEHLKEALAEGHERQGRQDLGPHHRRHGVVGRGQAAQDLVEAGLLALHEAVEARHVVGEEPGHLLLHLVVVEMVVDVEAHPVEEQPIHGRQPGRRQVVVHVAADLLEEIIKDEFHHQEGRPDVELVPVDLQAAVAPARLAVLLEHRDVEALVRQDHGGGQTARTGTNDDHSLAFHRTIPSGFVARACPGTPVSRAEATLTESAAPGPGCIRASHGLGASLTSTVSAPIVDPHRHTGSWTCRELAL